MRCNFVKSWSILLALAGSMGLCTAVSYAQQDQIPSISIPRSSEQGSVRPLRLRQAPTFNFDNPYLNDGLQLEYQINLLKSMIERQQNLARLEETYLELGSVFPTPDPPRGICEQIPVNVPCYKAYPELYDDVVVPEVQQLDVNDVQAAIEPLVEPLQEEIFAPTVVDLADFGPPPPSMNYRWADISCAGGQCSAVIVEEDRERSRRTVLEGDLLKGGVRVSEISARGVSLEYDGETVALDPSAVPERGGVGSPLMRTLAGGFGGNAPPEFEAAEGHNPFGGDLSQFSGVGSSSDGVDAVDVSDVVADIADTEPPITDPGPPSTGLF